MKTLPPLASGDHVHHDRLGLGRVITVEPDATWPQASIDFGHGPMWILLTRLRRLDLPNLAHPTHDLPAAPDTSTDTGCEMCIDGYQPGGYHNELGWVYARCLICEPACPGCDCDGLFPADQTCPICFNNEFTSAGQTPVRCGCCLGVIDILPIAITPQELPHDHI